MADRIAGTCEGSTTSYLEMQHETNVSHCGMRCHARHPTTAGQHLLDGLASVIPSRLQFVHPGIAGRHTSDSGRARDHIVSRVVRAALLTALLGHRKVVACE